MPDRLGGGRRASCSTVSERNLSPFGEKVFDCPLPLRGCVKTKINPLRFSYLKKFSDRCTGKRVLIFSFHTASSIGESPQDVGESP
jgi:hypothetical protein